MSYTVGKLKVAAYNRKEPEDMTIQERNLYLGLAYCYDWFKLHPGQQKECKELMDNYINFFELQQIVELRRKEN